MAKSKSRAKTRDRANPLGPKTIKPPADPELAALREKRILPIVEDLKSADSTKRSSAAVAIANIIEDSKCRKLLLREQVVSILLEQTVTDTSLASRSAGFGILRNLALEEDVDFCIHLYRQDVLTAIQGVLQNIIETVESRDRPFSGLPSAQLNLLWTLSSSVVGLIGSLAEAGGEIIDVISKIPVVLNFLFGLLNIPSVPGDLFGDVLTCLASLTEDNKLLSPKIGENEPWLKGLMQLREHGGARAVAACGILHNIFTSMLWFDHNTPVEGASDALLLPTLVNCMKQARVDGGSISGSDSYNSNQMLSLALEITASIATSLQEALEHAGKNEKKFEGFEDDTAIDLADDMMAEAGEDKDDPDATSERDEDELDTEEIDADMGLIAGRDSADDLDSSEESATLSALIRIAAPAVLEVAVSANVDDLVKTSALSALNNIAWTMSVIDLEASSVSLKSAWAPIAQQIWLQAVSPVLASNTADIDLASTVTSLAWAVARSVHGKIQIGNDEQSKFMALYQASKNLPAVDSENKLTGSNAEPDAFQTLGVKCVGVLGCLALNPASLSLNRSIGIFLITILAGLPETPAADAVEALNQLFDIYADESYPCDQVFWQDGFLKHLEDITPKVKKAAKGIDKRKFTELRARLDEALLNLTRFLKYKKEEKRRGS